MWQLIAVSSLQGASPHSCSPFSKPPLCGTSAQGHISRYSSVGRAEGPGFESQYRQSIDKRGSISEVATHHGASARNGPVRFRRTRAYCMATEPDRVHARLTLSPKTLYRGLASRVPPDGVGSWHRSNGQPSPKRLGILGAMIPVSVESRTALRKVYKTWLGMKCYFPVRYIRSASFDGLEFKEVHI